MRCTLRISQRGIFVDGEPRSRADAVAYCKGTAGAVVVIEDNAQRGWDATAGTMVVIEDKATKAEWDETRSALQREGVRIYVRGPLCYGLQKFSCRPRRGLVEPPAPRRLIVVPTDAQTIGPPPLE